MIDNPGEDSAGGDRKSVLDYAERLRKLLPAARIGHLHGRMKPKEKDAIMDEFAAGRLDVLVSTTVVEVGVDVPNAVIMLIENAERYGLSQLHQLRGRVGRGTEKSTCILVSDAQNQEAIARLQTMCRTSNGFGKLPMRTLSCRGPGDFFRFTPAWPAGLENCQYDGGYEYPEASPAGRPGAATGGPGPGGKGACGAAGGRSPNFYRYEWKLVAKKEIYGKDGEEKQDVVCFRVAFRLFCSAYNNFG